MQETLNGRLIRITVPLMAYTQRRRRASRARRLKITLRFNLLESTVLGRASHRTHRSSWARRQLLLHSAELVRRGEAAANEISRTRDQMVNVRLSDEEARMIAVAHSLSGSRLRLSAWARSVIVSRSEHFLDD